MISPHTSAAADGFWAACDAARPELEAMLPPLSAASLHALADAIRMARAGASPDAAIQTFARAAIADDVSLTTWLEVARRARAAVIAHLAREPALLVERVVLANDLLDRAVAAVAAVYQERRAQIRAAAESHRLVIEASPDPVISVDADGIVTAFNSAAERVFGYPPAHAVGRKLVELVIPERHRAEHLRGFQRVIEGATPRVVGRRIEMPALRADGSEIPVELAITVTRDAQGQPAFTGFLRDLSEQKRAEESVILWSHALEQAAFGIVVSERATRVIRRTNPAYAHMLGYEPAELAGVRGDLLLAPGSLSRLGAVGDVLSSRRHFMYELLLIGKAGDTVPVLISTSTVRVGDEELLISTVLDNRERLAIERERAEAIVELQRHAKELTILAAAAHEFSLASGTVDDLLEIVARRLSQAIGEACSVRLIGDGAWLAPRFTFYHPDPAVRDAMRGMVGAPRTPLGTGIGGKVAESGEPLLLPVVTPEMVASMTVPPFRDMLARVDVTSLLAVPLRSRGRTIGVVSLLRSRPAPAYTPADLTLVQDLADRAGLAIDNVVLLSTLERRVEDRTAALESANRELEAFSSSVSHDLRAPLRAIDAFSRALETDHAANLDDEGRHFLSRVLAATARMGRLIDDLLALARIGRQKLDYRELDLAGLAEEVVAELRRRDPDRAIDVVITPGLIARADARMITILFENLIGNAWKFTGKTAAPRIEIGRTPDGFFVRDNGAGFDMAHARDLFRPFQRLHASADFEGEGIGLATVHRIVSHHQGRIWADAKVGAGATFHFTLPAPASG